MATRVDAEPDAAARGGRSTPGRLTAKSMLDHVSIPVADLERSASFYDAVLATLGLRRRKERSGAIGYGPESRPAPVFWILARAEAEAASSGLGLHVSFQAHDHQSVDMFHATALRYGAKDTGPPGVRPHYTKPFYGAFVIDLDGFKIEAVCRAPQ
jgi:catechol 2,3-dioxygenase-like lactoylglutathione lyase family enzyme